MFKALATWLRFRPIAPSCRHDSRTVFTSSSVRTGIRFNDRSHFGTVAKLAMRQPFVLFKGLTFQKLCLPGAFRPGDH
ncbi:hypothetical protein F8D17_26435, partial [Klebsiella pneumoniae]